VSPPPAFFSSARFAAVAAELAPLAERFAAAGHRLYLVGGSVRDLVAGDDRPQFDLDATTPALPAEIKRLLQGWADAIWTQGERFGTIGAMKRTMVDEADTDPVERIFEITTHRAEAYRGDSRKPEVAFSDDVVADLSRRDFTVNAMAIEMTAASPTLVDPFHGADDLAARVLRTPLTPHESFSDDPLRMLRAARFVARYGLRPVDDLVAAVRSMGERLEIVSDERIRDELDKLLVGPVPEVGLRFVVSTGLAPHALPELTDPTSSVGVAAPLDTVAAVPHGHRWARWAAVFVRTDPDAVRHRMRTLRASTADVESVTQLVEVHHALVARLVSDEPWRDGEIRRLAHRAGPLLGEVLVLAEASTTDDDRRTRLTDLGERVRLLASREDLGALRPELDGAEVMRALGLPPGRQVGEAMAFLLELRLDGGPIGRDAARHLLTEWWTDHSK
jgi:poly(A) polymerase